MPDLQISIADFITQTWADYNSPTTSSFDQKMPKCRQSVFQIEENLDTDRSELKKLKNSVRALYNSTSKHAENEKDVSRNLEKISRTSSYKSREINSALLEFAKVSTALGCLIEDLSKSLHNSFQFPLESFLKGDIRGVKGEMRKPFDKAWKDYESKFSKLERDAKKKANEAGLYRSELSGSSVAEEMEKERKIFQLQLCMYMLKVNEIETKKGVDLLNYLVEYYKALKLFFEKGKLEVEKSQSFVDDLGQKLKDIKTTQTNEKSKLIELQTALKNSMAGYKEPTSTSTTTPGYSLHQLQGNKNHGCVKDGYLLKKSEGMLKKVWQKRKCKIKDGIMFISHSDETKEPVRLNLLTCQVKLVSEDPGKRCFDLVSSHGNRTYHFQSEDEKEMEQWISVLSNAKEEVLLKAFQDSGSASTMNETVRELTRSITEKILKMPGNDVCGDCGAEDPKWLSTNLGVLICLECCGIHRNLGVHVSRTQSLEIDQLGTSQLLLARVIGNNIFNEVLEAKLGDRKMKPKPHSPMLEREEFIKEKYVQHRYTIQTCNDVNEQQQDLHQAILTQDIQSVIQVYAEGLDLMLPLSDSEIMETALHVAIREADATSLPLVDFIVQNSNLNSLSRQTSDGNTCLHLCAMLNKSECMKCLLRTKPDMAHIKNAAGQTALDLAQEQNFQLCAELLKAAMAGKKDVFEHVNVEWDLMTDDNAEFMYSEDELESETKKRSRPASVVGIPEVSRDERSDSESNTRPVKNRKHHLTHPTRFRNSMKNLPSLTNSSSLQSLQTTDNPPLPPRGVKRPPPPLPVGVPVHNRTVSDPHHEEIAYMLHHRRTPSEPPRQFLTDSNRNTIAFPSSTTASSNLLIDNSNKPDVPPRPRTVSAGDDPSRNSTGDDDVPPPVPAPRKPKKINFRRCEALYDCNADNEDELTFREGEVIILVREEEAEWWEGHIEDQPDRCGLFPISFVKALPD